jgi:hypothetical protein
VDSTQERSASAQNFTFTPPDGIVGTPGSDAEPPQVVRSGDNVFIIWHEFPDSSSTQPDVFLSRSTNRGTTFRPRINLSNSPAAFSGDEDIAVSRSGNNTRVYVVWIEDADVRFRRDRTNDGTFANPVKLNDTLGGTSPTRPQIVASGDNVFVVWQAEHPQAGDNTDIFFARSTDSGDSFKDKKNISNNSGVSEAPQIALLADDRVIVTWRDDSGGDFEIFFARGQ